MTLWSQGGPCLLPRLVDRDVRAAWLGAVVQSVTLYDADPVGDSFGKSTAAALPPALLRANTVSEGDESSERHRRGRP